jgi:hypothetical protein
MRVVRNNQWLFEGKPFKLEGDCEWVGFVYLITNTHSGKRYIGKKRFFKSLSRKPLKGRVNKRRYKVVSDWENYYGSNNLLQEDVESKGKKHFKREILRLCTSLGEMSYYETYLQFQYEVLLNSSNWYNDWIQCKIHRGHLLNLTT